MKIFNLTRIATSVLSAAIVLTSTSLCLADNTAAGRSENLSYGLKQRTNNRGVCSFINSNSVNIRSGPGDRYGVVTRLNRGDGVRATRRQGNWVQITARVFGFPPNETTRPLNGWVSNAYINGCAEDEFDRWRS